ncbi:hypothetical protein [Winogradskyella sp. PC D3.3]
MKTRILSLTIIGFMVGTFLTSCGDASKKDMKAAKEDLTEVGKDLNKAGIEAQKEVQNTVVASWEKFKSSSETAINNTEEEIKVLRDKIALASKAEQEKLTMQLNKLEQKNKALKEKLEQRSQKFNEDIIEFNESAIESELKFEREFNHDASQLGIALKDLFKDNVN